VIRRRFTGLVSPIVVDDSHIMGQVPRLPFLAGGVEPACQQLDELFERAGDDTRIDNPHRQQEVKAAEHAAKSVCAGCPARLDCRAYAITTRQEWGIWGGTNAHERREWRRLNGVPTWEETEAMTPDELRAKFEHVDTIELFSAEAYTRADPTTGERMKNTTQRAIAYGNCPSCTKRPAAVVSQGQHWVWRTHYFLTWGRERRMCRASNVAVCVAPEPAGNSHAGTPVMCPHGPESDDAPAGAHERCVA
jgi:Zn ribbon nucleic-acid-binding protein